MNLLKKYTIAIAILLLCMMGSLAYVIVQNVRSQLLRQYEEGLNAASISIQQELIARQDRLAAQLAVLSTQLQDNLDFRFNAVQNPNYTHPSVIDYATGYMKLMGLQQLDITTRQGTLVSSGSDRNAFGRNYRTLLSHLKTAPQPRLTALQGIHRQTLCLTHLDSAQFGPHRFYLLGGVEVTPQFLAELRGDVSEIIALRLGDSLLAATSDEVAGLLPDASDRLWQAEGLTPGGRYSIQTFDLPLLDNHEQQGASLFLFHPRTTLLELLEQLQSDITGMLAVGLLLAIAIAVGLALTVTRPLKRLTQKAGNLTLDTLDVDFDVKRRDEIGILNDALAKMLLRLRQNRVALSLAEQKAAFSDIALQVNHDIKNGFIPIRNVMAHWEEVSRTEPLQLVHIFDERKHTINESLDYLEKLARNYSRLKPQIRLTTLDLNQVITSLLKSYEILPQQVRLLTRLDPLQPLILADPVQIRRAFENVLRNAIEALPEGGSIEVISACEDQNVRVSWIDSGTGIPEKIREQLFTSQVSTKPDGSGIGLANVKRIIDSFSGKIILEQFHDRGTAVHIILPLHGQGVVKRGS